LLVVLKKNTLTMHGHMNVKFTCICHCTISCNSKTSCSV